MKVDDAVVVVTGGGAGIGEAMCRRFAAEGAAVVVADRDEVAAGRVAHAVGGEAAVVDAQVEEDVQALVAGVLARHGRIDLMCANAGVISGAGIGEPPIAAGGGPFAPDHDWALAWQVNVMSQVHAARAVLPSMLERGAGYLLNTASAAGLLVDVGSLAYTVTKHAAVGLAEWLAVAYRDRGIGVSCLCPMGVRTPMLERADALGLGRHLVPDAMAPEAVADAVVAGLAEERFLILPHPEVRDYFASKVEDPERWLGSMSRLRRRLYEP